MIKNGSNIRYDKPKGGSIYTKATSDPETDEFGTKEIYIQGHLLAVPFEHVHEVPSFASRRECEIDWLREQAQ